MRYCKQAPPLLPPMAPAVAMPTFPMTPPDPIDSPSHPSKSSSVATVVHVLATERNALANLEQLYRTNPLAQENLVRAVEQIARSIDNGGKLVICGVGKSGKIARKLEATMNSMGVHCAFLHPTEALHGDLGMIRLNDTLLMVSFSGRTSELLRILPHTPPSVPIIAITAHAHPSTCPLLALHPPDMGILLPAPIHEDEELSFGIAAPTSSTTVALSLGDALAIAVARRIHTTPGRGPGEVFKSFHPGGAIGARSAACFPANTPMSTSASSVISDGEDPQTAHPALSPRSTPDDQDNTMLHTQPSPLLNVLSPVLMHQIPTVSSADQNARFIDVLLAAVQHPAAKSWIFLSPDDVVPPQRVRSLARSGMVDMHISELHGHSVNRQDWICVGDGWTVEDARRAVSERSSDGGAVVVVAVVKGSAPSDCLGLLEVEELWSAS